MSKYRATALKKMILNQFSKVFILVHGARFDSIVHLGFCCCWYFWQMNMIYYWQFVIRRRFSPLALWPHRSCVLFCLLNWDKTLSFHMKKYGTLRIPCPICIPNGYEWWKWSSDHRIIESNAHAKKENAHNKDRIKSSRFPLEWRE